MSSESREIAGTADRFLCPGSPPTPRAIIDVAEFRLDEVGASKAG